MQDCCTETKKNSVNLIIFSSFAILYNGLHPCNCVLSCFGLQEIVRMESLQCLEKWAVPIIEVRGIRTYWGKAQTTLKFVGFLESMVSFDLFSSHCNKFVSKELRN